MCEWGVQCVFTYVSCSLLTIPPVLLVHIQASTLRNSDIEYLRDHQIALLKRIMAAVAGEMEAAPAIADNVCSMC